VYLEKHENHSEVKALSGIFASSSEIQTNIRYDSLASSLDFDEIQERPLRRSVRVTHTFVSSTQQTGNKVKGQ